MPFIDAMMDQQQQAPQPPPALDENALRQAMLARMGSSPPPLATPPFFPGAPTLPSSPRNGSTAGPGGANASSPVSSDPAYPAVAPSSSTSTLDQIMSTDRTALEAARQKSAGLPNAPERANLWNDPNHGHLRTLLTLFAGSVQGGITGDVRRGMQVMEPSLRASQDVANQKWQANKTTAQQAYEDALQKFNVDLAQKREQDVADERTATEKDRTADRAEREKDRQAQLEIQNRNETREETRDKQAALDREAAAKNLVEDRAATQKRWQDEMAMRDKEFHQRLSEAKDAKEGVPILHAYAGILGSRLNEIDKRLADPAELDKDNLNAERKAYKEKLDHVTGLMDKHLGIGVIQPFKGVQNFTVAAQGKPSAQRSLTYEQVVHLQKLGAQLSPVQ